MTLIAWGRTPEVKIERKQSTVVRELPFETRYEVSRDVGRGRVVKATEGKKGKIVTTFETKSKNNRVIGRRVVSQERINPVHETYRIGREGFTTSRGSFTGRKILTMTATAYHPMDGIGSKYGGRTASGIMAKYGVVAVDPRVIPLRTWVYVEGYGLAIAADTGSAIKGNKIDLCMTDKKAIYKFGRRKVRVHVLNGR